MSGPWIDRRQLLIGAGAMSAACFAAACGGPYVRGRELPDGSGEPPIVTALRYGITAPSAHNTQPWRFAILADDHALLYVDPDRLLPRTDPHARQILISHGALVEVAAIGASAIGYTAEIAPLPDGALDPGALGRKPTASIRLVRAADAAARDPLREAIALRRTSRLVHVDPPPTAEEIAAITKAGTRDAVTAQIMTTDLAPILDIVRRAMAIEVDDAWLYQETTTWFRFSRAEVAARGDGLNLQTTGADTLGARLFLNAGNFASAANRRRFLERFDRVAASTRALLVLTTPSNTLEDWVGCGRAYVRAQLAAALAGLHLHPVSQVLQELAQMRGARVALDRLIPVAAPGNLQMLVRLGRTTTPPLAPRRPLAGMIASR